MPEEFVDIEGVVNDLQIKLERLRVLYEQYFLGISKREPLVQLKEVVRLIHQIDRGNVRNTALRFRSRMLVQKFNSYRNYWKRTLRAMDAGTYHRDVARVRRRYADKGFDVPDLKEMRSAGAVERALREVASQQRAAEPKLGASAIRGKPAAELHASVATGNQTPSDQALVPGHDPKLDTTGPMPAPRHHDARLDTTGPMPRIGAHDPRLDTTGPPEPQRPQHDARLDTTGPPVPPRAIASRIGSARPEQGGTLRNNELQSIYRRFVKAKKMCGEDASAVSLGQLEKTISRQLPRLKQMHGGRDIEFQVVIRGGRAILKAKPRD